MGIVRSSLPPRSGVTSPVHCNSGVHRANDSAQCCLHPGFLCGNLLANNTAGARPRPSCENVCRGNCAVCCGCVVISVWLRLHCAADAARRRLAAGSTGFRPGVDPGGAARGASAQPTARGGAVVGGVRQQLAARGVSVYMYICICVCLQVGSGAADRFSRLASPEPQVGRDAFGSRGIDKREAPNSQLSKPSSEAKSDSCPAGPR